MEVVVIERLRVEGFEPRSRTPKARAVDQTGRHPEKSTAVNLSSIVAALPPRPYTSLSGLQPLED